MVLSRENRSTGTTTCASATVSTIVTQNGPRSNPGFCGDRPRTNHLNHSTAYRGVFTVIECINPYPTAFPYGNGMVLHFYQQQESSTTKTVHKVINKGLKTYV